MAWGGMSMRSEREFVGITLFQRGHAGKLQARTEPHPNCAPDRAIRLGTKPLDSVKLYLDHILPRLLLEMQASVEDTLDALFQSRNCTLLKKAAISV